MIAAHQQITDETGTIFVLLPLEEYERLLEDTWHRRVFEESRGEESTETTVNELKQYLGLKLGNES